MSEYNQNHSTSDEAKHKQQRTMMILGVVAIVVLVGVYWLLDHGSTTVKEEKKKETVTFAKSTDHISNETVWIEHAQNELKEQQRKTAEINKKLEEMQVKSNESQGNVVLNPEYQALKQQVDLLQKAFETKNSQSTSANLSMPGQIVTSSHSKIGTVAQDPVSSMTNQIDSDVLNLKPISGEDLPKRNADTFVPAGTFAEAVVLGSADASAGVTSSSKPIPMLFRITADGTLPNHKKSHLKNCVVIGSVIGDISSERGEINLNRISCTFPNGEIVEQQVDGNIFGMDGKNGIRGNPVWREGALLGRAAVAGSLSGFSSGIAQSYVTNSVSPLGATQTVDNGAIFKNGLANGASNAMEKLAEYNIRRAEQYHPIIQIAAGQIVDVVFIRGFYLDGKKHDDTEQENNASPEIFPSNLAVNRGVNALTLSEQQLEKIKQHESTLGLNNSAGDMQ